MSLEVTVGILMDAEAHITSSLLLPTVKTAVSPDLGIQGNLFDKPAQYGLQDAVRNELESCMRKYGLQGPSKVREEFLHRLGNVIPDNLSFVVTKKILEDAETYVGRFLQPMPKPGQVAVPIQAQTGPAPYSAFKQSHGIQGNFFEPPLQWDLQTQLRHSLDACMFYYGAEEGKTKVLTMFRQRVEESLPKGTSDAIKNGILKDAEEFIETSFPEE